MARLLNTFDAGDDFTFRVYEIVKDGCYAYSAQLWSPEGRPVEIDGRGRVRIFPEHSRAAHWAEAMAENAKDALAEAWNAEGDDLANRMDG